MKENNIKAQKKNSNFYNLEVEFWQKNRLVCGVDEVGRGSLIGPIVTAAVILHPYAVHDDLKDSKLLSLRQLENIFLWIVQHSDYAIGITSSWIIDQNNIYRATQITMKKALLHLLHKVEQKPSLIIIDAMSLTLYHTPYQAISIESHVKGDASFASIAAASIVAKVIRDRIMHNMHEAFPLYRLDKHKGYGTPFHIAVLAQHQASVVHRKTFIKNFQQDINYEKSEQQNIFC